MRLDNKQVHFAIIVAVCLTRVYKHYQACEEDTGRRLARVYVGVCARTIQSMLACIMTNCIVVCIDTAGWFQFVAHRFSSVFHRAIATN